MSVYPTPHLEKLNAALENEKLPASDRKRVLKAIDVYHKWIADLRKIKAGPSEAKKTFYIVKKGNLNWTTA